MKELEDHKLMQERMQALEAKADEDEKAQLRARPSQSGQDSHGRKCVVRGNS